MIRIIYGVIIVVVGFAISFAGACRVRLNESFAENDEYTGSQHKLIGKILIVVGILAVIAGGVVCAWRVEQKQESKPQLYCNVCGGDLLCDVCGADGPCCVNSTEGYNTSAAHYCEEHWDDYISRKGQKDE